MDLSLVLAFLVLFGIMCIFAIGFLVGAKQQSKVPKQTENRFDNDGFDKEAFQKLAGIIPTKPNDELRQMLVKNNVFDKEKIIKELVKAAENSDFPAPDPSINIRTAKISTIDRNGNSDPLADLPMSRVSIETKEKIAELVKADIAKQIEDKVNSLPIAVQNLMDPNKVHDMIASPGIKPKRKYTKRKPKIVNQFANQNRAEIEANEAASIQLTGESDSHYYYKQTKDKKK